MPLGFILLWSLLSSVQAVTTSVSVFAELYAADISHKCWPGKFTSKLLGNLVFSLFFLRVQ